MTTFIDESVSAIADICDTIRTHGVYAAYADCITKLSTLLKIEDPAILNELMLYMSRLSFVKDKSAKYRFCTDEYARLLDCDDANKVVGKKENAFSWSKKAVAAADKAIKDVAGSEQTMILENLVKFPDGTERAMRTKLLPIYNSRNAVVGVFGVAVEVLQSVVAKPSVKGKKKTTTTA